MISNGTQVIVIDANRQATFYFLLVLYSNNDCFAQCSRYYHIYRVCESLRSP